MTTSLPLSLVVNVQLNIQPNAPTRRNFGAIALLTPEVQPFNDQNAVYLLYSTLDALGVAFGIGSETYAAATPFFAQSPRPKQIICARWDAAGTTIPATSSGVFGRPVVTPVEDFTAQTAGTFTLPINGVDKVYSAIDLSSATTYDQVAALIDAVITADSVGARWDASGTRFIIQSKTTGAALQLGFVKGSGAGYLGTMLALDNVPPTYVVPGADQQTILATTIPRSALVTLSGL